MNRLSERAAESIRDLRDRESRTERVSEKLAQSRSARRPEISLHQFLRDVWPIIEPDATFVDSWHVKCLCDHAQAVIAGYDDPDGNWQDDLDRLIVNIPPGLSKSIIFSIVAPCWAWTFRPTLRLLFLSFDDELAMKFSEARRTILMSEYYSSRWPLASETSMYGELGRQLKRRGRDSSHQLTNIVGGEMRTTTVGGKVTGQHPHVVVMDDPIAPPDGKEMLRADPRQLREFREWYRSKFVTRGYADDLRRKVILVGQRACIGDPTDVLLEEQRPTCHVCIPMEYDPDHPVPAARNPTAIGFSDPRREKGELICPSRLSRETVESTKRTLGKHNTAAQFQQAPQKAQGNWIKAEWFEHKVLDAIPEEAYIKKTHRHWDLAATEGDGDWTVGLKMTQARLPGDDDFVYYVEHVRRGQWGSMRRDEHIEADAQQDTRRVTITVEQEPGSGGKTQAESICRRLRQKAFKAKPYPSPRKGKFMAADQFVKYLEQGRIFLVTGTWDHQALIDELTSLEQDLDDQVDDQLDGCSGAFNSLTGSGKFMLAIG